jgi:hypothetical protein
MKTGYERVDDFFAKFERRIENAMRLGVSLNPTSVRDDLAKLRRALDEQRQWHLDAVATLTSESLSRIDDAPSMGFDDGEQLGRAMDAETARLAGLHGFTVEEVEGEMSRQQHADDGPHGRNK